jgi:hypothetical protein
MKRQPAPATRRWGVAWSFVACLVVATSCADDSAGGPAAKSDAAGTADASADGGLVDAVADSAVEPADAVSASDAAADATPTLSAGIWTQLSLPGPANTSLHGVWTDGPTRAVVVGSGGSILQYDGLGWKVASQGKFPSLNGVSGGGPRTFAVGIGGTLVQAEGSSGKTGSVWGPPGGCTKPSDCDDFDPCTADACESGVCAHQPSGAPGCCGGTAFADSFDKGLSQWTVAELQGGGQGGIVWSAAEMTGKDGGKRATSPPKAAYFGRTDVPCDDGKGFCPTFDNGKAVGSTMTSPLFTVPKAQKVTLSFQLLLDVGPGFFDQLQVWVVQEGGAKQKVWDKYTVLQGGSTSGKFAAQTVDLSAYVGTKIRLEVMFNSLDKNNNSGEGAFIDDLVVNSVCAPPAVSAKALTSGTLFGTWAAAADDAWAVGEGGFSAHWDGAAWTQVSGAANGGKAKDLLGIGGQGKVGLMVGDQGYAAQVASGGAVKALSTGATQQLRAVAVRASADGKGIDEAIAVGQMGTVLVWKDGAWSKDPASALVGQDLRGVAALGDGSWAAVSTQGVVWQRDAAGKWSQALQAGVPLRAVAAIGQDGAVAVGQLGTLVERNGGTWTKGKFDGSGTANAVWADAEGNAWAVGDNGMSWERKPDGIWTPQTTATSVHLQGVWANNPMDVFAVGLLSTIVHFDGAEWTAMSAPPGVDWMGVWGTATDDVYAIGTSGAVARWDGEAWTLLVQPVKETLRAVWGLSGSDVWAVGEKGAIYHSTGLGWQATPITPWQPDPEQKPYKVKSTLLAVWGAKSNDVWASGEPDQDGHGILVHWDGKAWTFVPLLWESPKTIRAMWGWSASRILMAGTQGTVLQLDGTQPAIEQLQSGTIATLFGIAPYGKDALLVGDIGVVLRYTPPK